jgi:hypothetical protein
LAVEGAVRPGRCPADAALVIVGQKRTHEPRQIAIYQGSQRLGIFVLRCIKRFCKAALYPY